MTLSYQFPVSDKLSVTLIGGDRFRFNPVSLPKFLPYYQVGAGPVSAFAELPPIYGLGAGSGISLSYKILKDAELTLTYLATFAGESNSGSGLFNGDYVAAAQLNYNPSRSFFIQGLYQHGYFGTRNIGFGGIGNFAFNNGQFFRGNGFIGSALANRFDDEGVFFSTASSVSSNGYHLGGYYSITPKFILGGWIDLINARLPGRGDANIWTYSVQAAFPDLFKPGNLGGLVVGMEPTLTGLKIGDQFVGGFKNDTSLHIEAYYRHQNSILLHGVHLLILNN
ncbi:MAG: iron uptake porin [Crinalium sp.]